MPVTKFHCSPLPLEISDNMEQRVLQRQQVISSGGFAMVRGGKSKKSFLPLWLSCQKNPYFPAVRELALNNCIPLFIMSLVINS